MANNELINVVKQGKQSYDEWRAKDPSPNLDLTSVDLGGMDFRGWNLVSVDFSNSDLTSTIFDGAQLNRAKFRKAKLPGVFFSSKELGPASLEDASFERADVSEGNFEGCNLHRAIFMGAKLYRANLRGTNIQNASFNEANLSGADFRGALANSGTTMHKAAVAETILDRYTLEQMEAYGGLTKGERMTLVIKDDVATLRQSFSGFIFFIHLITIVLFLAPYIWFLMRSYGRARFGVSDEMDPTVLGALARYVFSGGRSWYGDWSFSGNFLLVVWAVFYAMIRAILMWKAKSLELMEITTGLPASFSMTNHRFLSVPWKYWYLVARWGFWINLVVIGLHSVRFLSMRVPIALLVN